jgi:hypothetical protein
MFYPEDELAARQFYHLVREELLADAATPSSLFKAVSKSLAQDKLCLAGEVTLLRTVQDERNGALSLSKAAFIVSENHANDTDSDGKRIATSENVIRQTFSDYSAVAHFWAAIQLDRLNGTESSFVEFLAIADMIRKRLDHHSVDLRHHSWQIPKFFGSFEAEWPEKGLVANLDDVQKLLKDYKARSGAGRYG